MQTIGELCIKHQGGYASDVKSDNCCKEAKVMIQATLRMDFAPQKMDEALQILHSIL